MVLEMKAKEDKSSLTYIIQNIVVKSILKIEKDLDLIFLSKKLKDSKYDKDRFPGLFIKFSRPKSSIIIFRNGKLIITGVKAFSDINLIIERLILRLNDILPIDIKYDLVETQVVNIVVTADFAKPINIDAASIKLENSIYEPEVFPGLTYNSFTPVKSVFLIFSTGKVVLTGIRDKEVIEPVLAYLGGLLKKEKLFKSV